MTAKSVRVMIIAGEASGDLQGAHLANRLKKLLPDIRIIGIGGKHMLNAGVEIMEDSSAWSAIGINEALKIIPKLFYIRSKFKSYINKNPIDLLIPIDFGAFNVRLCKVLSPRPKTLYYFPPGSWKRNADYKSLSGLVDKVVAPFPWTVENLEKQGIEAHFFGHPLLDITKPSLADEEFYDRFGIDYGRELIALLPGSRYHEVSRHLPIMAKTAKLLQNQLHNLQFAAPIASSVSIDMVCGMLKKAFGINNVSLVNEHCVKLAFAGYPPLHIYMLPGLTADVLGRSRAAIVTSGTATLEAAILGCPMIIVYKVNMLAKIEYFVRKKNIKFIGMPNIILDREICPELIQDEMTAKNLVDSILPLICDNKSRQTMVDDLQEVKNCLGAAGAIDKTAALCVDMLMD